MKQVQFDLAVMFRYLSYNILHELDSRTKYYLPMLFMSSMYRGGMPGPHHMR